MRLSLLKLLAQSQQPARDAEEIYLFSISSRVLTSLTVSQSMSSDHCTAPLYWL